MQACRRLPYLAQTTRTQQSVLCCVVERSLQDMCCTVLCCAVSVTVPAPLGVAARLPPIILLLWRNCHGLQGLRMLIGLAHREALARRMT